MPNREYVLAGKSLHTERPYLDKRFDTMNNSLGDYGNETKFVGIAYDSRHRHPVTNNPILWLAGDTNCKILAVDAVTMHVIESFNYPTTGDTGSSPATKCYGLAILMQPTDCIIGFLSEPNLDATTCPVLFHLKYDPAGSTPADRLKVENWYYVNTTSNTNVLQLSEDNRAMTEYRGDFMILGKYKNMGSIIYIDKLGLPLASYAKAFKATDDLRGILHIHDRVYTTMDLSTDPEIGGRSLVKFITDEIDRQQGQLIPLPSIEPFFLPTFKGSMAIYQDRMAACDGSKVYLYKMIYFCFIVNEIPNDDIEMGSIIIGESKVKDIKFKNIADYYMIKDVVLTKGTVICPNAAQHCPASEALAWVKFSVVDPEADTSTTNWVDSITFANTSDTKLRPDGESRFWIKITVPNKYTNIMDSGGSPKLVTVDDGPFAIPLEITAKIG